MIVVCAWCQETPDQQGSVSHSICEACFKREMESLEQEGMKDDPLHPTTEPD